MKRTGQIVFLGAVALALALYGLTVPEGLPWNASTALAVAYLDETLRSSVLPHPIWGFYVQVFGGPVVLSVCMAAFAAGLLAAMLSRLLDGRIALCGAVVFIFLPGVWNRAVTGDRGICLLAMAFAAMWILQAIVLRIVQKVRETRKRDELQGLNDFFVTVEEESFKPVQASRFVARAVCGLSGVVVLVSWVFHDFRIGEAAGVFAEGVARAAHGRIIVLNGICDEQIRNVAVTTLSMRNDEAHRAKLMTWVKSAFPTETNLWAAARVSAAAFAEAAVKVHPDDFYLMDGLSTTPEAWEARWKDFGPQLESSDPFVRVARRQFGREGNRVATTLPDEAAYALHRRVYEEVDPGNVAALVARAGLICRGYAASGSERKNVQDALERFLRDTHRDYMYDIARSAGQVKTDPELLQMMVTAAKKCVLEKVIAGGGDGFAPEILSLDEWHNALDPLIESGDLVKAGRVARKILQNPKWHGFVSANAVMGAVAAGEDDYVASEAFFRVATSTTNRVETVVLNDYVETLVRLGRLDEAEEVARRAVRESDEDVWLARLALMEVLVKKLPRQERVDIIRDGKTVERFVRAPGTEARVAEIKMLLKDVLHDAPAAARERIAKVREGLGR